MVMVMLRKVRMVMGMALAFGNGNYVKDLGINCFHFPKHQISSLSLVPTILALVDRNDESVVILKITIDKVCCALQKKTIFIIIEEIFLFWTFKIGLLKPP